MSYIDKVIGYFNPKAAFLRTKYRWAAQQLQDIEAEHRQRRYEAAGKGTRRTAGWDARSSSANEEINTALPTLRNRSRDLVRNNPYAKRAVQGLATNIIGSGIRPSPDGGTKLAEKRIKDLWRLWADTVKCDWDGKHNFYGLQRLAVRTIMESGEVLIVRRRTAEQGLPIPIQLQVLEADFIDTLKDGIPVVGGGEIIQGVEFSAEGKRVAYWLFDRHPGDSRWHGLSKRVPITDVLHVFPVDRPGQVRGVPVGVSGMTRLRDFDEYEDAQLLRQKIAACFSVFVQGDESSTSEGNVDDFDKIEPGQIYRTGPGETVTFGAPPGAEGYDMYTRTVLRSIASAYGVTYEMMTGDLSNVNFSSGRMGWIEFHRLVTDFQEFVLIPQMCNIIWEWFLDAGVVAMQLRDNMRLPATWTAPRREMIDPEKEVKGMSAMVSNGFASWSEILRQNGYDPDNVIDEIKKDLATFDELGIKPACDPRTGSPNQPAPEAPAPEGEGGQSGQRSAEFFSLFKTLINE